MLPYLSKQQQKDITINMQRIFKFQRDKVAYQKLRGRNGELRKKWLFPEWNNSGIMS